MTYIELLSEIKACSNQEELHLAGKHLLQHRDLFPKHQIDELCFELCRKELGR